MFNSGLPTYAYHQMHQPHERGELNGPQHVIGLSPRQAWYFNKLQKMGQPIKAYSGNDTGDFEPLERKWAREDQEKGELAMESLLADLEYRQHCYRCIAIGLVIGLVTPYFWRTIEARLRK